MKRKYRRNRVCVLIPYYEAGDDLLESIMSCENDRLRPDICVVDDGSTKTPAREILEGYHGPLQVRLITLRNNEGIVGALNVGLRASVERYRYIARLDCGDLNLSNRIADQYDFMESMPECGMVGGWADYVDTDRRLLFTLRHPVDSEAIRRRIYLNSPFTHPAVMLRSAMLPELGFYPTNYPAAEDLALFFLIVKNMETANLPRSVVSYIVDTNSISSVKRKTQIASRIRLIIRYFNWSPLAFIGLFKALLTYWVPRVWIVHLNRVRFFLSALIR